MTSPTKLRAIGAIVALALSSALALPTADAQETSADERARIHFQSGREYYANGDYESALRDFRAAYELSHREGLLFNIYLSEERVGQFGAAASTLERYLTSDEVSETDRPQLEARLVHLRERAAQEERAAEERAARDEHDAEERSARESREGMTSGEEGSGAGPDASDTGPALPAIVAWSVGAAGLVAFGVFGGLALAEDSRLASDCGADRGRSCPDASLGTLHAFAAVADVGWIVALAGGLTGTLLYALGVGNDDTAPSASAWIRQDGAGVVVGGRL
jgi:tetratricopeptide (TPR) repeat protein